MECVASLFGALGVVGVTGVSVFLGASVDGELLWARSQTAFFASLTMRPLQKRPPRCAIWGSRSGMGFGQECEVRFAIS